MHAENLHTDFKGLQLNEYVKSIDKMHKTLSFLHRKCLLQNAYLLVCVPFSVGSVGPPPELVRQREAKWINIIAQWDRILLKKTSKVCPILDN